MQSDITLWVIYKESFFKWHHFKPKEFGPLGEPKDL